MHVHVGQTERHEVLEGSLVVKLHGKRAELRGTRTSPLLRGPSTIARAKDTYLVVNADFATSTKPFTVAGLPR